MDKGDTAIRAPTVFLICDFFGELGRKAIMRCLDPPDVIRNHHPGGWLSVSILSPLVSGRICLPIFRPKTPSGLAEYPDKRNPDFQDRAGIERYLQDNSRPT